jgi:hypothetical protein
MVSLLALLGDERDWLPNRRNEGTQNKEEMLAEQLAEPIFVCLTQRGWEEDAGHS